MAAPGVAADPPLSPRGWREGHDKNHSLPDSTEDMIRYSPQQLVDVLQKTRPQNLVVSKQFLYLGCDELDAFCGEDDMSSLFLDDCGSEYSAEEVFEAAAGAAPAEARGTDNDGSAARDLMKGNGGTAGDAYAAKGAAEGSETKEGPKGGERRKGPRPKVTYLTRTFTKAIPEADKDVRDQVQRLSIAFFQEGAVAEVQKKGWQMDVFVMEDGRVIAFILYGRRADLNFVEVKKVYVVDDMRKYGLGRKLVKRAVSFCKVSKYPGVALWAYEDAVHFYKRVGFHGVDEDPATDELKSQTYMELYMKKKSGGRGGGKKGRRR